MDITFHWLICCAPVSKDNVSSFIAEILDALRRVPDPLDMKAMATSSSHSRRTAEQVRRRIGRGGERLWRLVDFSDLSFTAVAQTLSRLAKAGAIEALSNGVYYRARQTSFGKSRPNPAAIQKLASGRKTLFPSGIAAANLLGFTTQSAGRNELATSHSSLPRKLVGLETVIHMRRPEAWSNLSEMDAALLDFLRRGGKASELSPQETVRRTLDLLSAAGRFERLSKMADILLYSKDCRTFQPDDWSGRHAGGSQVRALDRPIIKPVTASGCGLSFFSLTL
jgi:hypothetical protein